ncbi:solute carrier family 12 member 8 isoform X1 [Cephus cinctus]|uniref:Solute carrier family 12 member 8 n=1 Tax=Cephus cinctus TaxID=211228 RepID=A0AAJ7C7E4_CEPCN|nr:solute carrier family 12 member 8 isoform X1 [Cephus cinctus]XP_015603786.1 solute carrier family 12 member 8 isoform X1 [Cephus cinctus]XP_024944959.1 solute carrier family 12 member 8 isoform X1 [Cephus cinctus]XP_024944964.1 solute carrier family 12 member 8 isoform X1 [Cephus cinctus]XP_024944976.1 solute carrier family 12 member 8 isoform X1 [Cephus cinctus]
MESLERNHTTEDNVNDRNVDWSRFGLGNNDNQRVERRDNDGYEEFNPGMYQTGVNELFAQEYNSDPWWKSNFFLSQPVLFGTWDGVFTSCLINIFGVIVFLRSGWIVGQAGALNAVLIILSTVSIALVTVLSAVGICERCRVESGGVYFLLSHVLGSRFGGSIGLLYCFGQAVGCALNVLGFGESMAGLVGLQSAWVQRGFACAAVILLSVINVAGVKWVVKLQFVLLIILLLAGVDFIIGSFIHENVEVGFEGWLSGNLKNNTFSAYEDGYGWFTVFGVFFPTVTGVLAGINMSGDLRHPSTDIPNGTLAALGTGTFLYLCFSLFLAATCTRTALLTDFMIASTVSAFSVLLLAGLYVSSFSSCLGAMYGTPRVLQSIASQNVIPGMSCLQRGRGPNKVPVYAMIVVAIVTLTFIITGQINTLAPIVTMPFLLTYACMDYAYFALAQTFDIRHTREQRFDVQSPTFDRNYGSAAHQDSISEIENDLDSLFPERIRHKNLTRNPSISESTSHLESSPSIEGNGSVVNDASVRRPNIHKKLGNWYSPLCNRWFSLLGALIKILIMFLVHWGYAIANIVVVFVVWSYVGHANPAVKPGVSAEFKFFEWLRNLLLRIMGRRVYDYEQIIVTSVHPGVETRSAQLNEENEDFASRRRYHQTATVTGHYVNVD